jgi:hypothetical protein
MCTGLENIELGLNLNSRVVWMLHRVLYIVDPLIPVSPKLKVMAQLRWTNKIASSNPRSANCCMSN